MVKQCRCVDPSPFLCLVVRFNASVDLAKCLGGYTCLCHVDRDFHSGLIPRGKWLEDRRKGLRTAYRAARKVPA